MKLLLPTEQWRLEGREDGSPKWVPSQAVAWDPWALPQDRGPPRRQRSRRGQSLGITGKCKESGAQCPLSGNLRLKQERTGQGHMTVSSKARSPIPPEASCPGFGTLKTHPFPTLGCTPGCVEPMSQAHWLKPWPRAPWSTLPAGGAAAWLLKAGNGVPYLTSLSRSFPGTPIRTVLSSGSPRSEAGRCSSPQGAQEFLPARPRVLLAAWHGDWARAQGPPREWVSRWQGHTSDR